MEQETSHMDRLTQTQNSIDDLVRIISSTLSYLSRKASFKQINPNFPVTQAIPEAESPEVFEANKKELVTDFLLKAKQLEFLIDALPSPPPSAGQEAVETAGGGKEDEEEFKKLEEEMRKVNDEYFEALGEAEDLHKQLEASLRGVLESRSTGTAVSTSTA
ncbi:hypothetical protein JCM11251_004070 [Rhodosporidiobolus azoricus]